MKFTIKNRSKCGWLAKDRDGGIWFFNQRPQKGTDCFILDCKDPEDAVNIGIKIQKDIPELTFENSPKKVEMVEIEKISFTFLNENGVRKHERNQDKLPDNS